MLTFFFIAVILFLGFCFETVSYFVALDDLELAL